jgi:hypothetical protein
VKLDDIDRLSVLRDHYKSLKKAMDHLDRGGGALMISTGSRYDDPSKVVAIHHSILSENEFKLYVREAIVKQHDVVVAKMSALGVEFYKPT